MPIIKGSIVPMTTPKMIQEILPWDRDGLERLLRDLIEHGSEAAKVDFKAEIETVTPEQRAKLLTDISAMANTYDDLYADHGFLIYGIREKMITGITQTEKNTGLDPFFRHQPC